MEILKEPWIDLFTIIDTLIDHPELHIQHIYKDTKDNHFRFCIASWICLFNANKDYNLKVFGLNFNKKSQGGFYYNRTTWVYARDILKLTEAECEFLFSSNLNIQQIKENAILLAKQKDIFKFLNLGALCLKSIPEQELLA